MDDRLNMLLGKIKELEHELLAEIPMHLFSHLRHLNLMERFNCGHCEYVNGLLAYLQEIAGRTEQYWCPIKHATSLRSRHNRYQHFMDYGDAEHCRQRIERLRRDFSDLNKV